MTRVSDGDVESLFFAVLWVALGSEARGNMFGEQWAYRAARVGLILSNVEWQASVRPLLLDPSGSATVTVTPLSRRFNAWARP